MANKTGKGTFQKGDSRINRSGRPKSFDGLRELAQKIAHEAVEIKGDKKVIKMTVVEAILRQWAQSKDARLQQAFIAYAYGKVPDQLNLGFRWEDILPVLPDDLLDELGKGGDPMAVMLKYIGAKGKHDPKPTDPD